MCTNFSLLSNKEATHNPYHKINLYYVHIEIAISEKNKIVSHENRAKYTHENEYSVIRDAYDAA